MSHHLPNQPSRNIPLKHHDPIIVLQRRRDKRTREIQRETTRVPTTSRSGLNQFQEACVLVDGEGDQGVGGKGGAVRGVEVGDCEGVFAAGGDDEEFVVGLVGGES